MPINATQSSGFFYTKNKGDDMSIDKKEIEGLKSVFYAMVDMPEKQRNAFRDIAKNMNKFLSDEAKQEGRDKTRAVMNSILDDSFAEQDRLAALDTK